MDPLFKAISYFRIKKFQQSIDICTENLSKNPLDQVFWVLKMRCITQQMYVDDLEADEHCNAESLLDSNFISQVPRPGTSLRANVLNDSLNKSYVTPGSNQSIRPVTQSGRPITGILRPDTQSNKAGSTLNQILKTPRTSSYSSRPLTNNMGRSIRLGTASMMNQKDEKFIDLNHLNLSKYSLFTHLNKPLYEYIIYFDNDLRTALNFAALCSEKVKFQSWWWKKELGKCYYKLNLLRDSEKQFRSAFNHLECDVETYLWLGKVYLRFDQPLKALEIYKKASNLFLNESFLKCYSARIHENLNQIEQSFNLYTETLIYEPINCEALSCIAMHYFYNDQPELALRYYRRLLQMGMCNAEIYNNIALCCYYSQQYDMVFVCFERALMYSDSDELIADVWYNCGLVVLATGDNQLACQCFKLALIAKNNHPEAYNNLAVTELIISTLLLNEQNFNTNKIQKFKSLLKTASSLATYLYEPNYNLALLYKKSGQYELCYQYVKKSLDIYPGHYASQQLFTRIKQLYEVI